MTAETLRALAAAHASRKRRGKREDWARVFAQQIELAGLPVPTLEHRFAEESHGRAWRFDFAWPDYLLAVEIEGIVFRKSEQGMVSGGRHASPTGFREDCRKYATAVCLGWAVMRFDQVLVREGDALSYTIGALERRGWS